jgi:uncharacterized protein YcbK (DUF882 family)
MQRTFFRSGSLQHPDSWSWTRRSFLKTSVVGLLLLGGKLLYPSVARANDFPDGELTFFNVHTDERLRVRYRDDAGNYDLTALDEVNHILRCHHTGEVAAIDVRMLEHVNLVHKAVYSTEDIHVISGYRSPGYNAQLVKRSRRVAQHSLHIEGQALDFYIPGIEIRELRHAALKLQYGGVGVYPRKKFIHLDCGPFRTW